MKYETGKYYKHGKTNVYFRVDSGMYPNYYGSFFSFRSDYSCEVQTHQWIHYNVEDCKEISREDFLKMLLFFEEILNEKLNYLKQ